MTKPKLLFTPKMASFVLSVFNKIPDSEGFIIDSESREYVLTPEGDKVTLDTFGGILKGNDDSPIFLKEDLLTAIKLAENAYNNVSNTKSTK